MVEAILDLRKLTRRTHRKSFVTRQRLAGLMAALVYGDRCMDISIG